MPGYTTPNSVSVSQVYNLGARRSPFDERDLAAFRGRLLSYRCGCVSCRHPVAIGA